MINETGRTRVELNSVVSGFFYGFIGFTRFHTDVPGFSSGLRSTGTVLTGFIGFGWVNGLGQDRVRRVGGGLHWIFRRRRSLRYETRWWPLSGRRKKEKNRRQNGTGGGHSDRLWWQKKNANFLATKRQLAGRGAEAATARLLVMAFLTSRSRRCQFEPAAASTDKPLGCSSTPLADVGGGLFFFLSTLFRLQGRCGQRPQKATQSSFAFAAPIFFPVQVRRRR